jgi:hypothetical protein
MHLYLFTIPKQRFSPARNVYVVGATADHARLKLRDKEPGVYIHEDFIELGEVII